MSETDRSFVVANDLKVGVLMGGIGNEREVSLASGRCVCEALASAGLDVVCADIGPDRLDVLDDASIDVFFPALHGEFGEDGRLQEILEERSLCYCGSGPAASRLAFDKMESKKAFAAAGVAGPAALVVKGDTDIGRLEAQLRNFADRYVVKPIRQGSSVGVSIVSEAREAALAAHQTFLEFGDCMVEQFVPGREVTVGVLCDDPLPIIEIRPQSDFYDYQAKYADERTQYLFDTIDDPAIAANLQAAALDCFEGLGCRHFARVDFILSDDEIAYALEANTIPGFTTHSLLPKAAARAGLSMSRLCMKIVRTALEAGSQRIKKPATDHNR